MKVILKQNWNSTVSGSYKIYTIGIDTEKVLSNITNLPQWVSTVTSRFAVIVLDNDEITFAAVDHLSNYPLYYSDTLITDNWFYVDSNRLEFTENKVVSKETWLLAGQNLSADTCFNEVKRIMPNHYLKQQKQYQYRWMNRLPYAKDNIRDFIVNKFLELEQTDNTLMFSGGVDSVFLMNLVVRYGTKNWRFIHMHSDSDFHNETAAVEYFEKFYNVTVEKYNIDKTELLSSAQVDKINTLEQQTNFANYWYHDELYGKFIMFEMAGVKDELIWTGEVADQLFGNPKINALIPTWIQTKNVNAIADLWIDTTRSLVKSWINDVNKNHVIKQKFTDPVDGVYWQAAYNNVKTQLIKILEEGTIEDIVVRFTNYNYLIKGQLRVWPYSQLPMYNFSNLFTHYELAPMVFSLSSNELAPNGLFKGYLYNLFPDELPIYAWQLPKTGPTQKIKRLYNEFISKF
jgi:hypothetical protein